MTSPMYRDWLRVNTAEIRKSQAAGLAVSEAGIMAHVGVARANYVDIRSESGAIIDSLAAMPDGGLQLSETLRTGDQKLDAKLDPRSIDGVNLPAVGPLEIGLPGWWQIDEWNAVVLVLREREAEMQIVSCSVVSVSEYGGQVVVGYPLGFTQLTILNQEGLLLTFDKRARDKLKSEGFDYSDEKIESMREFAATMIACVLVASTIMQADPDVVVTTRTPPKLLKAARKRGNLTKPEKTTRIELPGLRYEHGNWRANTGRGVAWHMVRGHWRNLTHPKYREQRRVWVRPHSKGSPDLGTVSHHYTTRQRSAGEQAARTQRPPIQMVREPNPSQQRETA